MQRSRLTTAVLHLVLGGLSVLSGVGTAMGDTEDVVVDVVLMARDAGASDDDGGEREVGAESRGGRSWSDAAEALAAAEVDVVVLDAQPGLPAATAQALVCEGILAFREAGALKIIVGAVGLTPDSVGAIGEAVGFRVAGVRRDGAVELYRDLYARRV